MSGKVLIRGFTVFNNVPRSTSPLLGTKMRTQTPSNPRLFSKRFRFQFSRYPRTNCHLEGERGNKVMQFLVLMVKWQCRVNGVRLSSMLKETIQTKKQTNKKEQESTKQKVMIKPDKEHL